MKVCIRKRKRDNGQDSLFLDYYYQGRRVREVLGLYLTGDKASDREKLRLAEVKRSQLEVALFSGAHGLVDAIRSKTPLVDYAKKIIQEEGKAKSNLTRALPYVENFFGPLKLEALNTQGVVDFQKHLQQHLKDASVETYMNALTKVLNQAVQEKIILASPANGIKRVRGSTDLKGHLTVEELVKLEKAPIMGEDGYGGEVKRAFLFCCQTGLRWADVCSLIWGEIRGRFIEKKQGKTNALVKIPINETAWQMINPKDRIPPLGEKVFALHIDTDPNQYLRRWGTAAGISQRIFFHLSRHTAGTLFLEAGVDHITVKNILGHKKIDMTERYAKVTDQGRSQAGKSLDELMKNAGIN